MSISSKLSVFCRYQSHIAYYFIIDNKLQHGKIQAKEKLIETLKDGTAGSEREPTAAHIELEELRQERDMLKEDLQQVHLQVYNLKAEITVSFILYLFYATQSAVELY